MKRLFRGGRVVDPSQGIDARLDVLVEDGRIEKIGADLATAAGAASIVEVPDSMVLCPGLVDMHVHLREPGDEHKETVATGVAAAAAGGFTSIACMPNTRPVNDSCEVTRFLLARAAEAGTVRVYPIGAVTAGSNGEVLCDLDALREAGCVAFSDDGRPVVSALLMRRALERAARDGFAVIDHCEDPTLKGAGVAHEGRVGAALGLAGIPSAAEDVMVARDLVLAAATGGHVHIAHLSTRGAISLVREAKTRNVRVTCEATPHHLLLTDDRVRSPVCCDPDAKMNPPLREAADRDALIAGLADGTVDAVATDHAPHHPDEKREGFVSAPFGVVGLETAVSLMLDRFVHQGVVTLGRLIALFTTGPAGILRIPAGTLAPGSRADLTVLAPDLRVVVKAGTFRSKGRNTPFEGWSLRGGVAATIVAGRTVYANPAAAGADVFVGP